MMAGPVAVTLAEAIDKQLANAVKNPGTRDAIVAELRDQDCHLAGYSIFPESHRPECGDA